MKWLFRTVGSAVAALVVTAGAAIITAIWLMFSEGSTEGRRLGFFEGGLRRGAAGHRRPTSSAQA